MEKQVCKPALEVKRVLVLIREPGTEPMTVKATRRILGCGWRGQLTVLVVAPETVEPLTLLDGVRETLQSDGLAETRVLLRTGDAVEEALAQAERNEAEVIVACDGGVVTQRLLRRSSSSLLILPDRGVEAATTGVKRIVVPVDFSPESEQAVRFALALGRSRGWDSSAVELVHVCESNRARKCAAAEHRLRRLIRQLAQHGATGARVQCRLGKRPADSILELARQPGCTELVHGCRRRSVLVGLQLPGVTERVVLSAPVPVWVVRDRLPFLRVTETT